jgi:CRP/FNR family transcriptional regulator
MSDLPAAIFQNELFTHLSAADRAALARLALPHGYQEGQLIAVAGETWPYLFAVAQGKINVLKESSEGRSLIIASLQAGEIFWGLAFFDDDLTIPVTLACAAPCQIYLWRRQDLLPFLLKDGGLSWALCQQLVRRMQRASEIVEELAFQPVAGRLARLLLDQFDTGLGDRVSRHLTLDEMAAHVGTTREVVCRVLYRFAQEGAIQIERTEFKFTDVSRLKEYAGR